MPAQSVARPATAWKVVLPAAAVTAVMLTLTSGQYGYHRDELYFRMLPLQWGYVDQPPLTPALVHLVTALSDTIWALHALATLLAVLTVLLTPQVTRELGGGVAAQALAAWGTAFGAFPVVFGHVVLTSTLDLTLWVALSLLVIRALLRDPRWWLAAGALTGAATWNKWLIGLLVVSLAAGLAVAGPRRLPWRWVGYGALVGGLIAVPNLVYQASHAWPQLTMGRALSQLHGAETRALTMPLLVVMLGFAYVPVWVAGLVALWRRPQWRPVRCLAPAFLVLLVLCLVAGGQPTYPIGLLLVVFAAGCIPAVDWLGRTSRGWRLAAGVAVVVNVMVNLVLMLPVIPLESVGATPIPAINQVARDTVGWPTYVEQVAAVWSGLPEAERRDAILVTSNYGEAGAIERFGPTLGLPRPFSGQNELWFQATPPDSRGVAVVVGGVGRTVGGFATCTVGGRLDNGVKVANEEQQQAIWVCRDPVATWAELWPRFLRYS